MTEPQDMGEKGTVTRADDTWERSTRKGWWRRLTLRRADGLVYLDRRGVAEDRIARVLLHKMSAPDPGIDLHDHPWWFVTIPLWGGYTEQRANVREACEMAALADQDIAFQAREVRPRGRVEHRRPFRPRTMRLDECHTIVALDKRTCWTLVIGGPRRRQWGFYLADGYMPEAEYDATVRAERRDLWSDQRAAERPWDAASLSARTDAPPS